MLREKKFYETNTFLFLLFTVGILVGAVCWNAIRVPFRNPYSVISPLTLTQFNPATNLVRYVFLVTMPSFLLLLTYWFGLRRPKTLARAAISSDSVASLVPVTVSFIVLLFAFFPAIRFATQPLPLNPMDLFHEGEFLAPAIKYWYQGTIWSDSYFVHGGFYDPLASALSWKLFNVVSIGASRWFHLLLDSTISLSLVVLFVVVASVISDRKTEQLAVIILFLALWELTLMRFQYLDRRDVPVILAASFLMLGIGRRMPFWWFAAGLYSALQMFYSIDRGAYLLATLLVSLAFVCYVDKDTSFRRRLSLGLLVGIVLGFVLFRLGVGGVEFSHFVRNTLNLYTTKDFIDSYKYPSPLHMRPYNWIPIVAIAIQGFYFCYRFVNRSASRVSAYDFGSFLFFVLAFFYFRSALGRSDWGHVFYASTFAFLGLVFPLLSLLRSEKVAFWVLVLGSGYLVINQANKFFALPLAEMGSFASRTDTYVHLGDEAFLNEEQREVFSLLRDEVKDPCLFVFNNETAWNYLLRKPACSKYQMVWFGSTKDLREQVAQDLLRTSPRSILYQADGFGAIDNVMMKDRLPEVFSIIQNSYFPKKSAHGRVVYQKNP